MIEETLTDTQLLKPKSMDVFDMIIIGAGPAGMSAAICSGRAGMKVLILEKALPGGQCSTACKIDNYIGFPKGILGVDLAKHMEDQLEDFDIYYHREEVTDVFNPRDPIKIVSTDLGNTYKTKSIIIAVGLEPKRLDAPFERQFLGRGISYYAQCDAESYKDADVVVIGGGNCACYAADYLSRFVKQVYMVHQFDHLRAVKTLKESIENNPKINIIWNSKVSEVFGIDKVEKIKIEHVMTQQHTWLDIKGIFIYVGRIPPTTIISPDIDVDEDGFIITDEYTRTNIPGIYAAGDIRVKQVRQITTATSDGMLSAINVERDIFR